MCGLRGGVLELVGGGEEALLQACTFNRLGPLYLFWFYKLREFLFIWGQYVHETEREHVEKMCACGTGRKLGGSDWPPDSDLKTPVNKCGRRVGEAMRVVVTFESVGG